MKILFTTFFVTILSISVSLAQNRIYKTVEYMSEIKSDENIREAVSQIERDIVEKLRFASHQDYTLPIVFHVVLNSQESRISKEKLQEQINILNQDFAGLTEEMFEYEVWKEDQRDLAKYEALKADARIQFCYPDSESFEELGITEVVNYQQTSLQSWENFSDIKEEEFGLRPISPSKLINVWITDLPEGNAGYAQMPGGSSETDGVVIDYKYIESIGERDERYNGGHTLTHLIGNYLGLLPLWGEYSCGDDYVFDTPVHNAPNFEGTGSMHVSGCTNSPTEMVINFMDSSDDECLSMFTNGQVHRMQILLSEEGPRGGLTLQSTNCETMERSYGEEIVDDLNSDVQESSNDIIIFPNPVQENLHITYQNERNLGYQIEIYTLSGQLKQSISQDGSTYQTVVNVENWEPGLYILLINNGLNEITQNFIVQ